MPFLGMIYILFIGVIVTLLISLANAYTCVVSYKTLDGGYNVNGDRASCDTGCATHDCELAFCRAGSPRGPIDREKKTPQVMKAYTCLT
ncbi:hypothetical protein KEM48_009480 [Puccinia striiformis f. sp. tritici PST-130]|nr:hypothetical protein KEM48_009480 [Puccinia striiformis f. sp. tritici PST-130]